MSLKILKHFYLSLMLMYLHSAYLKAAQYNWSLHLRHDTLKSGTADVTFNQLNDNTGLKYRCTHCCQGHDYSFYKQFTKMTIVYWINSPQLPLPLPSIFYSLFDNNDRSRSHTFKTQYLLRGQTGSNLEKLADSMCCPCLVCLYICSSDVRKWVRGLTIRLGALNKSTPNNLPDHVSIEQINLSHSYTLPNGHTQVEEAPPLPDSTTVIDLFLQSSPWLTDLLSTNTGILQLTHPVVIPELFSTVFNAVIEAQPSTTNQGPNRTRTLTISVPDLNCSITYNLTETGSGFQTNTITINTENGYTLTFTSQPYVNQPPPSYQQAIECGHHGACNCATYGKNDTDDKNSGTNGSSYFYHQMNSFSQ
jgi:hypothetical protein